MKKYKIPEGIKEIAINEEGKLVYLKKELMERVDTDKWEVIKRWKILEEIK